MSFTAFSPHVGGDLRQAVLVDTGVHEQVCFRCRQAPAQGSSDAAGSAGYQKSAFSFFWQGAQRMFLLEQCLIVVGDYCHWQAILLNVALLD